MSTVEQEIADAEQRIKQAETEAAEIRAALDEFTTAERAAETKSAERRSELAAKLAAATELFLTSGGKQDDVPAVLEQERQQITAETVARNERLIKLHTKIVKPNVNPVKPARKKVK